MTAALARRRAPATPQNKDRIHRSVDGYSVTWTRVRIGDSRDWVRGTVCLQARLLVANTFPGTSVRTVADAHQAELLAQARATEVR